MYLADDMKHERKVALKVLKPGPWCQVGTMYESMGLCLKGEWDRSVELAAAAVRDFPDDNQWTGLFCGWELTAHAYAGTGAALGLFRNREGLIPKIDGAAVAGDRSYALMATEALAVIGSLETAAALYAVVL